MSEVRRIRGHLRATFDGTPWHGQALSEILDGVEALEASAHSVTDAHSIWELVLHMTYWRRVALEALAGKSIAAHQPNTPEDWRTPGETTDEAWQETRDALRRTQDELLAALDDLDDGRLTENVPGREYSFYVLLHGVVQHDVYHAGQIALLRKGYMEIPW